MIKLHAQLEQLLKIRINSNSEIILGLKKLSEAGKLDKPKELAMFAVILDRLGKLEDEATIQESLKADDIESIGGTSRITYNDSNAPKTDSTDGFTSAMEDYKIDPVLVTNPTLQAEAKTSLDAPEQPEQDPTVQTTIEATPETPIDNEVVDDGVDIGTISEFTPENIAAQPTPETQTDIPAQPIQPPVEPATSS